MKKIKNFILRSISLIAFLAVLIGAASLDTTPLPLCFSMMAAGFGWLMLLYIVNCESFEDEEA